MKIKYVIGIVMLTILALTSSHVFMTNAQEPTRSNLKIVSSDETAVVVELTVNNFEVETIEQAGQTYQRLIIADMGQTGQAGEPQVPTRGTLLGLPSANGVSVEILATDSKTLTDYHLYPAPKLEVKGDSLEAGIEERFAPNVALYATNASYPGQLVKVGDTGYMRDQAVAQVQFYPIQYNPVSGKIEFYQRIVAKITWQEARSKIAKTDQVSPDYENVLKTTLLNYATLTRPSVAHGSQTSSNLVASQTASNTLKIGVKADGLYQLTFNDLKNVGFDLQGVDPKKLQLTNRSLSVPIYVMGEEDGTFDATDSLLFYGLGLNDIYTSENIYWLTVAATNGARMESRQATAEAATNPGQFPTTFHAEENSSPWYTMPNGEGQDLYFWGQRISPSTEDLATSKTFTVTLSNVSPQPATLRVKLKGYTTLAHHSKIYLNDIALEDKAWSGQAVFTHEISIPLTATLKSGENVIKVEAMDTGAVVDGFFINWLEIDYAKSYVAENNQLTFAVPAAGRFQFNVTNFTKNEVQLFNITDPAKVIRLISPTVTSGSLQFSDDAVAKSRYLALTADNFKKATLTLDQPSNLKATTNGADYIIITHKDFYTSALTLANYRQAKDRRVMVVKVEDIYDEFNDGIFNPQAIRDFLTHAYNNWTKPAPVYVVLVGDGIKDYRGYLSSLTNYIPARLVETTSTGMVVSDNWYVSLPINGMADVLPDMLIGRLSVRTSAEADDMIAKIKYYEQNPPTNWGKNVLLIADDNESEFMSASNSLSNTLPYNYITKTVYVKNYTDTGNPTTDIKNVINNGTLLVNYTGHGDVGLWGVWNLKGTHIFDDSNVDELTNTNKLPIVTVANCLSGDFAIMSGDSIAEKFLRLKDKGAAAAWAPAGLGFPDGHRQMMVKFYEAMFRDDLYQMGQSTNAAQLRLYGDSTLWGELVKTYILFGDPAMKVGITNNAPYIKSVYPANVATSFSIEGDIKVVFNKEMDPSKVKLTSNLSTVFTPTWSVFTTTVTFAHANFEHGQTINLTISGQDPLGNALKTDCAPTNCTANSWSFTTIAGGIVAVKPDAPSTLAYTDTKGISTLLEFPSGAVTKTTEFLLTVDEGQWPTNEPSFANRSFNLRDLAYLLSDDFRFAKPVKVTIHYSNADIGALAMDESNLVLRYYSFNQHTWLDVKNMCNPASTYSRDPAQNTISVNICNIGSSGQFALFEMTTPQSITVGGPTLGAINTTYAFTAGVTPISASVPIIYEWTATGGTLLQHPNGGVKDTALLKWSEPGIKEINVKANSDGSDKMLTATYKVYIVKQLIATYLPLIVKGGGAIPTPTPVPGQTTKLVIHGKHTGQIDPLEVRGPSNELLLSCKIGSYINETTQECGSFNTVSAYTITAKTAYCGDQQIGNNKDAVAGQSVTKEISCDPVTLTLQANNTGGVIDKAEITFINKETSLKETLTECSGIFEGQDKICEPFDPVGTYTIEADTLKCGKVSKIYFDGAPGAKLTKQVSCP